VGSVIEMLFPAIALFILLFVENEIMSDSSRFRIVQEFIRELGAKPSYIVHGDHVVKLTLKVRKIPDSIVLPADVQEEGLVFSGKMIKMYK
jgi:hypothetical protein